MKTEPTPTLAAVDQPRLVMLLPWYRCAWICFTNPRAWRTRRKIDKAICAMIRAGINPPLAYELLEESNRLWDEAFSQHNAEPIRAGVDSEST